jgi:penicillin-binding protein 1A
MAQLKTTKKLINFKKYFILGGVISFILFVAFLIYVISGLPPVEDLENPKPLLSSNVWSEDGELIGQFFIENRLPVKYKDINQSVVKALIATEDVKFYRHWGVDIDRFVKAMVKTAFGKKQGASTITQQLAKIYTD